MALIGYARVSKREQNLDLQMDALNKVECDMIYSDKVSGVKNLPELNRALDYLRAGDKFVVWKLCRLGRTSKDLVSLVYGLKEKGIDFMCITQNIDTSTPSGKFQFSVFASLVELERDLIIERTNEGLQAARERGRVGGRKKGLSKEAKAKAKAAASLYKEGELSVFEVCKSLDIKSKATLYRYLRYCGVEMRNKI